jgi:hypothetical protein
MGRSFLGANGHCYAKVDYVRLSQSLRQQPMEARTPSGAGACHYPRHVWGRGGGSMAQRTVRRERL